MTFSLYLEFCLQYVWTTLDVAEYKTVASGLVLHSPLEALINKYDVLLKKEILSKKSLAISN